MAASEVIYQLRREVAQKDLLIEKLLNKIEQLEQDRLSLDEESGKKVDKSSKVNF